AAAQAGARLLWRGRTYLSDEIPGWTQEKIKSVIPGNILVSKPITGARPKPVILTQNSHPNSPGFVLVTWLNVASRCIPAYTFTITEAAITNSAIKTTLSGWRGSNG